jgi:hypothetical protein
MPVEEPAQQVGVDRALVKRSAHAGLVWLAGL